MAFDAPRIPVPRGRRAGAARGRSHAWLILFLVVLLILLALLVAVSNLGVSVGTQNQPEGQCQFTTRSFATRQEAFTLAQAAEQYRSAHPFGGNYSLGSYTICYKDGTQQRFPSFPAQGYDNKTDTTKPVNATHGEHAIYNWLQNQFAQLSIDVTTVQGIYAVIFSQVLVCGPCRSEMVDWQQVLRQKARTTRVFLSIWDLNPGFDPATFPAGPKEAVALADLERVPILFTP